MLPMLLSCTVLIRHSLLLSMRLVQILDHVQDLQLCLWFHRIRFLFCLPPTMGKVQALRPQDNNRPSSLSKILTYHFLLPSHFPLDSPIRSSVSASRENDEFTFPFKIWPVFRINGYSDTFRQCGDFLSASITLVRLDCFSNYLFDVLCGSIDAFWIIVIDRRAFFARYVTFHHFPLDLAVWGGGCLFA